MDDKELKLDMAEAGGLGTGPPKHITSEARENNLFNSDVAEKVMRWRAHEGGRWFTLDGQRRCYTYEWNPKENIVDVWQVVEWLVAKGYEFTLTTYALEDEKWCAVFFKEHDQWEGFAKAAPHAISLAALTAVEANG